MNRNKRVITGITAGMLLIAFFLPWWKLSSSVSGWELVFRVGGTFRSWWLIIPVTGCVVLYSVLARRAYLLPKKLLFIMPLLAFSAVFLLSLIEDGFSIALPVIKSFVKSSSIGFWLTGIATLALPFCSYSPGPSSKRVLTGTMAAFVIIGFVIPWLNMLGVLSGWNMVFGGAGPPIESPLRFMLLIIPASAAIILGSVLGNLPYLLPRKLLFMLPFLTLVVAFFCALSTADNYLHALAGIGALCLFLLPGFWLMAVGAVALLFLNYSPVRRSPATVEN